jgi:hypothetical protein
LPAAETLDDANNQTALDLSLPGTPNVVVQAPGQTPEMLPLEETVPGHYEVRVSASQPGLYRVASGASSAELPEVGFYRESEETKAQAVNVTLLGEISRLTGGRMRPSMDQVLSGGNGVVSERRPLWPYLLSIALLLNFLEVALRKGFFDRLAAWFERRAWFSQRRHPAQIFEKAK